MTLDAKLERLMTALDALGVSLPTPRTAADVVAPGVCLYFVPAAAPECRWTLAHPTIARGARLGGQVVCAAGATPEAATDAALAALAADVRAQFDEDAAVRDRALERFRGIARVLGVDGEP